MGFIRLQSYYSRISVGYLWVTCLVSTNYQLSVRRDSFLLLSRRLLSRRRSTDPRVGRDFLRGGAGGIAAVSSISRNWVIQSCLLRHWLRLFCTVIRISAGRSARTRSTAKSGPVISDVVTVNVDFEDVLLMCWPPAPVERANVQLSEAKATTRPRDVTTSSSAGMGIL
jgi:hypothetical protein